MVKFLYIKTAAVDILRSNNLPPTNVIRAVMRLVWSVLLAWLASDLVGQTIQLERANFTCAIGGAEVSCLYQDPAGTIWIGTSNTGVFRFNAGVCSPAVEVTRMTGLQILSIEAAVDGAMYIQSHKGHFSYDGYRTHATSVSVSLNDKLKRWPGIPPVLCSVEGEVGDVLLGTERGLYACATADSSCIQLIDDKAMLSGSITALMYDNGDQLWIGSGETIFLRTSGATLVHQTDIPFNGEILANPSVAAARVFKPDSGATRMQTVHWREVDREGRIWYVATAGDLMTDIGGWPTVVLKDAGTPGGFTSDRFGNAWIECRGALYLLEPFGSKYRAVRQSVDLPGRTVAYHSHGTQLFRVSQRAIDIIRGNRTLKLYRSPSNMVASVQRKDGSLVVAQADHAIRQVDESGRDGVLVYPAGMVPRRVLFLDASANDVWLGRADGLYRVRLANNSEQMMNVEHIVRTDRPLVRQDFSSSRDFVFQRADPFWYSISKAGVAPGTAPRVSLAAIQLSDGDVRNSKFARSFGPYLQLNRPLELPYSENNISFSWQGTTTSDVPLVYNWRLVGASDQWSPDSELTEVLFAKLAPGRYSLELRVCDIYGNCSESQPFDFSITKPLWQAMWFHIALFMILAMIVAALVRYRINRTWAATRREMALLHDKMEKLRLEQQALRLQMNPHFLSNIFQAMDINIVSGNVKKARSDLVYLSEFMRELLLLTRAETTSLEREIEFLTAYVGLEKSMRNADLEITVECQPELEAFAIQVPTMLFQPLVENAIVHGGPKVHLSFEQEGQMLRGIFSDNGPGVESLQSSKARSVSLDVVHRRLRLMGGKMQLLKNNQSTWTRILIEIPIRA